MKCYHNGVVVIMMGRMGEKKNVGRGICGNTGRCISSCAVGSVWLSKSGELVGFKILAVKIAKNCCGTVHKPRRRTVY